MIPFRRHPDHQRIKPGDVIGFSGESFTGDIINIGTYGIPRWDLSHVGIMGEAANGRLLLFESTTLDPLPCEITGKPFNGTQAHQLDSVVQNYRGKVWHYSLYRPLYGYEAGRLTNYLTSMIGVPYGKIEAVRSGGELFSFIESFLHPADMHHVFCSEYVAAALARIGLWPTDNAGKWNPNKLTRHLRAAGVLVCARRIK
jgi:hypothetical protein